MTYGLGNRRSILLSYGCVAVNLAEQKAALNLQAASQLKFSFARAGPVLDCAPKGSTRLRDAQNPLIY